MELEYPITYNMIKDKNILNIFNWINDNHIKIKFEKWCEQWLLNGDLETIKALCGEDFVDTDSLFYNRFLKDTGLFYITTTEDNYILFKLSCL